MRSDKIWAPIITIPRDGRKRMPLYYGELAERLIRLVQERMEYDKTRFKPHMRMSYANIARLTGIGIEMVSSMFQRRRKFTLEHLDKILIALDLSLLDLLRPEEINSCLAGMSHADRAVLHYRLKKTLDNADEQYKNSLSGSSQNCDPEDYKKALGL